MSTADSTDGIDAVYSSAGLLDASTMSAKRPNKRGEQTRDRLIAAAVECFTDHEERHGALPPSATRAEPHRLCHHTGRRG